MGVLGTGDISLEESLPLVGGTLTDTLTIDQDANASAIVIDSESTNQNVIQIASPNQTSGRVINIVSADNLSTGSIIQAQSNSSNTSTRDLVIITNDNTLATGAVCLSIRQDAANHLMDMSLGTLDTGFIDFQATADADATSAISTLTTSGATTHHIQVEINGVTAWIAVSTTDPS